MEQSFIPDETTAKIKETFEIKSKHKTGHATGLVVVLDQLVTQKIALLIGQVAFIRTPDRQILRLRIDDARDHGKVNSLFFKDRTTIDIPVGSEVVISALDE